MLKPNSNFKLPKPYKVLLASILDPHLRGQIKRSFIEAELYSHIQPKVNRSKTTDKEVE